MHSVLIVATVDRGHGDSVGGQVGGVPRLADEHLAGTLPQQMLAKSPILTRQHRTYADQWP
jgi:hypothetical protein